MIDDNALRFLDDEAQVAIPSLPDRAVSRAVLIGTSDFEYAALPGLPAVRHNLTELSDALTNGDTGILDWNQCFVIDTPDSPASFMSRLRRVASQAEDLLVVYYAGHGLRHDKRNDLYLTVRQTDPDELDGTGVPFDWVREAIEHSPARTRLLILDCCFSGMALGSMSSATIDVRDVQISGTCVITSSPRNEGAHSPPGERLTAFTGELISLLEQGPRTPGTPLTVQALYRGLVAAMANRGFPEPKMRAGDLSADLLLRRLPAGPQRPNPQSLNPHQPPSWTPTPPSRTLSPSPQTTQPQLPGPSEATMLRMAAIPHMLVRKAALALMITSFGRLALWIVLALFLDITIGGLVGSLFGTHSGDLGAAATMALMTALFALIIIVSAALKRHDGNRMAIAGDLRDTLAKSLVRWPTGLLLVLATIFLLIAVAIPFSTAGSSPAPSNSISDLASVVAMELWLVQLAGACLYASLRRARS